MFAEKRETVCPGFRPWCLVSAVDRWVQRVLSEWKVIETSVLASTKEAIWEGGVRAIVEVGPKKKSHIVTLVGTVWWGGG